MGSPETYYGKDGEPGVSSTEWVLPQDGLVPVGAHGDERNLHPGQLLQPPYIFLGGLRKVSELPGVRQVLLPPLQLLVDGDRPLELGEGQRDILPPDAVDLVRDAYLEAGKARKDVELGERYAGEGVQPVRVPDDGRVEPAASPRTPRGRSVLAAAVPDLLALPIEEFRGERAAPNAGGVGLGDAAHTAAPRRGDAP